jgi:hypothetical protein
MDGRAHRSGTARRSSLNAWLFEDFDPHAQPIKVIDGKTLW